MAHEVLRTHYTAEDYAEFPDDGKRYEIIAGEVFVNPAPSLGHQDLVGRLYILLHTWARGGAGGRVFLAPTDVHLAHDTIVQPDLLWISPGRIPAIMKDVIRGAPDLVVEVLSPRTARTDQHLKRDHYALHGVLEYWLVDPQKSAVTILTREEDAFRTHESGSGPRPIASSLDPALVIDLAELFLDLP